MASEAAATNRSIRNVRSELEFLCDMSVISQQQLSSILAQLPTPVPLTLHSATVQSPVQSLQPSIEQFNSLSVKDTYTSPVVTPGALPLPPAYPIAPSPPALGRAVALYSYKPTDAGDLALIQADNIVVYEHMNSDCMLMPLWR